MKKNTFRRCYGVFLLVFLFVHGAGNRHLFAQCLKAFGSSGISVTPLLCDGETPTPITGGGGQSVYYYQINVTTGQTYTFTSNVATDLITISIDSGKTASGFDKGKLTWVSTIAGIVRMYIHGNDSCADIWGRTLQVICGAKPACNMPVASSPSTILTNVATLNWLPPSILPSLGYQYYISTSGAPPASNVVPSGSTGAGVTSVTLSNLTPGTVYYAWVRAYCQVNEQSYWTALPSFSTLCYDAPIIQGGQRCGAGAIDLHASAVNGATIKWYPAPTGRKPIGSGNTFTTPIITNTTTFYAEAQTVSDGLARLGTDSQIAAANSNDYSNFFLSAGGGGNRTQMLFLASELQSQGLVAGNITALSIEIAAINPLGILNDFTIRLGGTTDSVLSGFTSGTTLVYNATYSPNRKGTVNFKFSTPYPWDGVSNLIVETIHNSGNFGPGSGTLSVSSTTSANSVISVSGNYVTPATADGFIVWTAGRAGALSRLRPNLILFGASECGSLRVPVVASVTPGPSFSITEDKTVCNEEIRSISVTSPSSHYDQISWQPAADLFTDPGATVPYVPNSSATTVYFKSSVAGTFPYGAYGYHTGTACGALDSIAIQTLPSSVAAVSLKGLACQTGNGVFNLSPAILQTGQQYQWQQAANNITFTDIAGATSASYTTPMVSSTSYYRVKVHNSDGLTCFYSASDSLVVSNPGVTQATAAERCGPGTLQLTAEARPEYQLNWYASDVGGSPLATGPVFQTPAISSTTTYYVGANAVTAGSKRTLGEGKHSSLELSNIAPFNTLSKSSKRQMLIAANELKALGFVAGNITSLAFDISYVDNSAPSFSNFKIKLISTLDTALTSKFITGGTYVLETPSITPVYGLNTYDFTTPYYWDGSSNVVVQICHSNRTGSYLNVRYDSMQYAALLAYNGNVLDISVCEETNGSPGQGGPLYKVRPKMVLGFDMVCESNRTPVVATVKALPSAPLSPSGPQRLCKEFKALTTSGGATYAWLHDNALVPGAQDSMLRATQDGAYKVIVTGANGCADTSVVVQLTRMDVPVSLGKDTSICRGSSITLDAGNAGSNYLWNNAATSRHITVAEAGTYYVTVTDSDDCSGSDTIVLSHFPVLAVDLGNDTGICQGATLTLDAGSGGAEYFWDNGALTRTRTVNRAGVFSILLTDVYGCSYHDTIQVMVIPPPSGSINIESGGEGDYTFSIANPQHVVKAIWNYGDGQSGTGNPVSHSYKRNGDYTVTLLLVNDCGDTVISSKAHQVKEAVGIEALSHDAGSIYLYPNPAHAQLYIKNELQLKLYQVNIYNMLGQKVYEAKLGNSVLTQLNIGILPGGIYTVQIDTDMGRIGRKMEVIR